MTPKQTQNILESLEFSLTMCQGWEDRQVTIRRHGSEIIMCLPVLIKAVKIMQSKKQKKRRKQKQEQNKKPRYYHDTH